jgi:hypothetical protein
MNLLGHLAGVTAFFALVAALALVIPIPVSAEEHEHGDYVCEEHPEDWRVWQYNSSGFWYQTPFSYQNSAACNEKCVELANQNSTTCHLPE